MKRYFTAKVIYFSISHLDGRTLLQLGSFRLFLGPCHCHTMLRPKWAHAHNMTRILQTIFDNNVKRINSIVRE